MFDVYLIFLNFITVTNLINLIKMGYKSMVEIVMVLFCFLL